MQAWTQKWTSWQWRRNRSSAAMKRTSRAKKACITYQLSSQNLSPCPLLGKASNPPQRPHPSCNPLCDLIHEASVLFTSHPSPAGPLTSPPDFCKVGFSTLVTTLPPSCNPCVTPPLSPTYNLSVLFELLLRHYMPLTAHLFQSSRLCHCCTTISTSALSWACPTCSCLVLTSPDHFSLSCILSVQSPFCFCILSDKS